MSAECQAFVAGESCSCVLSSTSLQTWVALKAGAAFWPRSAFQCCLGHDSLSRLTFKKMWTGGITNLAGRFPSGLRKFRWVDARYPTYSTTKSQFLGLIYSRRIGCLKGPRFVHKIDKSRASRGQAKWPLANSSACCRRNCQSMHPYRAIESWTIFACCRTQIRRARKIQNLLFVKCR